MGSGQWVVGLPSSLPTIAHYPLLTAHCLLPTAHLSLLTPYCSLRIPHCSLHAAELSRQHFRERLLSTTVTLIRASPTKVPHREREVRRLVAGLAAGLAAGSVSLAAAHYLLLFCIQNSPQLLLPDYLLPTVYCLLAHYSLLTSHYSLRTSYGLLLTHY